MTYLEIIEWIQENVNNLVMQVNGQCYLNYIDDMCWSKEITGKDIVSTVLEINGKELIK